MISDAAYTKKKAWGSQYRLVFFAADLCLGPRGYCRGKRVWETEDVLLYRLSILAKQGALLTILHCEIHLDFIFFCHG